ncbi:MAG: DUF4345 family protein [Cyclobacteriaceae bacterium]
MKSLNYIFFYTYIGLVILAGFWGAFIYPVWDFQILFQLDLQKLPEYTQVNLLSQYRFLRALELGFGLFAILFLKEIFSRKKFNQLFLGIMGLGVLARMVSWSVDGIPSSLFIFFLAYEALGLSIIFAYSRKLGIYHASRD